jgi:hypothetical protein
MQKLKVMNYAIEILENELNILQRCLNEWDCQMYPEAKKEREKRLNDINNAINKLNEK